jgi:hypothetical protein
MLTMLVACTIREQSFRGALAQRALSEKEEPAMRILILAAIVALAGCASASSEHAEAPAHEPGKALAFNSNNEAEFNQAAQRAQEWCAETYDSPAKYLGRRDGAAGDIVTFGCTTN